MPETFLARFPVSVNTENSRRTREKPLVPRVVYRLKENFVKMQIRFYCNRAKHPGQSPFFNKISAVFFTLS